MHLPQRWKKHLAITGGAVALGLGALALFPDQILGGAVSLVADDVGDTRAIVAGEMPAMSTMLDARGGEIAHFFDQRRRLVEHDQIAPVMIDALVAVEDQRFFEHGGVDWRSVARAVVGQVTGNDEAGGGSTLTQQYVKNYLWLVDAENEAEQQRATEQTYGRKVREMEIARAVDAEISKDELVTRYLNLVSFGQGAFGVDEAAHTYFGVAAKDLNLPQAALLAGLVQAPEGANPYRNPEAAKDRRNVVLDKLMEQGKISDADYRDARSRDLGVQERPTPTGNGCTAAAPGRGFFCRAVVDSFEPTVLSDTELKTKGLSIETTLDPVVQDAAQQSVAANVPADPQVAGAVAVVGVDDHVRPLRALAVSVPYGNGEGQSALPLGSMPVGDGAGSTFKVFASAAALGEGYGIETDLAVPKRVEAYGLGTSDMTNCPSGAFCVENAGDYPATMPMWEALAKSPNTPFVQIAEQIGNGKVVGAAVDMGVNSLRAGNPPASQVLANSGSFVLGTSPVSATEMASVGATITGQGSSCSPRSVIKVVRPDGLNWPLKTPTCAEALDPKLAAALAEGMTHDVKAGGTAAAAATELGWQWDIAAKTGTTSNSRSAAFLGATSSLSAFGYIFNYGQNGSPLCTAPVRTCAEGDLFGGNEPARITLSTLKAVFDQGVYLPGSLQAEPNNPYRRGAAAHLEKLVGLSETKAGQLARSLGFSVKTEQQQTTPSKRGTVLAVKTPGGTAPGSEVVLVIGTSGESRSSAQTTSSTSPRPSSTSTARRG